ncbi:hypothetical protein B0H66DRAFT_604022 [Apodospora peruviana]|uniref:ABM domain-containing protein n=1 Tax=Apodospora peruviana TaxID=516989 RepID=A0AAE0M1E7_9PEZI|nr:hypothetical protein B0H66DRAFT_604022 [Apodospora peruviana]
MTDKIVATELIYLNVKPIVKPEDDDSATGRLFLNCVEQLRLQPHAASVFWGRSIDNPDIVAVAVRWTSTDERAPTNYFRPYEVDSAPETRVFYVGFDAGDLTSYPTTEIALPSFSTDATSGEELDLVIHTFMEALSQIPDSNICALGVRGGWMSPIASEASPTGLASMFAMVVGWPSKNAHLAAAETETFKAPFGPMIERMIPFGEDGPGIHLMHFKFRG